MLPASAVVAALPSGSIPTVLPSWSIPTAATAFVFPIPAVFVFLAPTASALPAAIAPSIPAAAPPLAAIQSLVEFPFESVYVRSIVYVSLYVSVLAVLLSTAVSLPVALLLGFTDFAGKRAVTAVINTGMGFPSVVVGLLVLFAVSNQGPLGTFDLVFTREAMIMSQFVLATPAITAISLAAVSGVEREVREAARALGGTRLDVALVTVKQARYGIATAVLAGFGRAISEVGSVLIVGGNIAGADGVSKTRTLTTAIQLEARQGRYETAMVLGGVLVVVVLIVNAAVVRLGDEGVAP